MRCMVASMPYDIWTCFWWGNRRSPEASLPRPGSGNQLSYWTVVWCGVPEVDAGIYDVPVVLNWIQDSINAFITNQLLTHSSHMRPATGRTQAHCNGVWSDSGSTTWETSADTVSCCHGSRKCNAIQNGMKPLFSRGCLSSLPMDCPIGKTACQTDILLLPNWTGWCPWSVVDLDLYFDDSVLPLLFCAV